jgi:adenosylhomocysteine nucleosidase
MTSSRPKLLVITGLKREARIAAGEYVDTLCSGGNPVALAARLANLSPPTDGILSFGLAGGLAPDLSSGDIVVASEVFASSECLETDTNWQDRIVTAMKAEPSLYLGPIAARDAVLTQAGAKAELNLELGALAVDMESHLAASYAHKHGLPFAVIRAISDPVTRSLPDIAANALTPDGDVDLKKVVGGLLRQPGQLPALIAAGIDSERAFASLRRCRRLLGPLFGLGSAHL